MLRESAEGKHVIVRDFSRRYRLAERGEGVYVWDDQGRRYLDSSAGSSSVVAIGHGVVEVAEAMAQQARKLAFAPMHMFTHRPIIELTDLLAEIAPGTLTKVWLVSGGSEATENAVKLARQYHLERGNATKHLVISRWESFHGATLGALAFGGHTFRRRKYVSMLQNHPHIPPAYRYRCEYCHDRSTCTLQCAHALEKEIRRQGAENVAAFIAEPVVAAALGAVPAPAGYFQVVREICDRYDVLLISDEVITGFGRTGTMWGIEHWGVEPDLVATAKGMSGGYAPLGGVLAKEAVVEALADNRSNFVSGHTYVGHPVTSAAGVAVLRYLLKHDLVENSRVQGAYLLAQLEELLERRPLVGDVRGLGLMCGVELVRDRTAKEPFPAGDRLVYRVADAALDRGLITYPLQGCVDGVEGDMIMLTPPLCITAEQIDELVAILDDAISAIEAETAA
jgi:adenosylmethionine-8-amino-7-oxononanoate aminotransferase